MRILKILQVLYYKARTGLLGGRRKQRLRLQLTEEGTSGSRSCMEAERAVSRSREVLSQEVVRRVHEVDC